MRNLWYLFADSSNHKAIVYQLDFIGTFLQANVKHIVSVKLDSIYGEYFPEYAKYFLRTFRLKKSMYVINNSGKIFYDELTNFLIDEAGLKHSQCQIYIYFKYETYGSKSVVLSYIDDYVYCHTY